MGAGPGIEPGFEAYETSELPLLYPAIIIYGAGCRDRTDDLPLTRRLLYH